MANLRRRRTHSTRDMDSADTRNVCRYFLNGTCRYGSRCLYLHEMPVIPSSRICRFFQKGDCWFGQQCRNLHVRGPEVDRAAADRRGSMPSVVHPSMACARPGRRGSEPALLQPERPARWVDDGAEPAASVAGSQDSAHLTANISEERAQEAQLDFAQRSEVTQEGASRETEVTSVSGTSGTGAAEVAGTSAAAAAAAAEAPAYNVQSKAEVAEAFLRSKNVTCGICMDKIYEKPDPRDQVFGILPNCNHSYCLQCIKTWRKTKDFRPDVVKACPECRVNSAFYVPNKYWVEGQEKERLIVAFKEKFSKRRCSFFARFGCCPFKTECLHRHDGPYRLPLDATEEDEGEVEIDIDLLGFLLAMTLLDTDGEDVDFELQFFLGEGSHF